MILKVRNAICNNCGGMRPMNEQYSFREISNLIGSSTDKGAEKAYHTALDRITAQLAEDNVIRVVDMVRIEPERVKKKKESAIPLKSQPVLKSVYTNWKNGVCIYTSQNAKIPRVFRP